MQQEFSDGYFDGRHGGRKRGDSPEYIKGYRSGTNERMREIMAEDIRRQEQDEEEGGDATWFDRHK